MLTAANPIPSEMRAPYTTREKTSRPRRSVPKGCDRLGRSRAAASWKRGPLGAMAGAARATSTRMARMATPTTPPSRQPDPRVEPGIGKVDQQRHDQEDHGGVQGHHLDHRVIATAHGLQHEASEAVEGE